MRIVDDILGSKPAPDNIIGPDALVIDALTMLNSVNLSYLIVMEGSEYKGIFCERDYSRNVILKGRSSNSTSVKEVMTTDLTVVHSNDTVEHCMHVMNKNKARYLVAYGPDNEFEGVITIHDLLRQVIANKELVFDTSVAEQLISNDEKGDVY
jgi:signal-transduction protein with cAMP-binding, CBS, and nucleotidyltransferase domain